MLLRDSHETSGGCELTYLKLELLSLLDCRYSRTCNVSRELTYLKLELLSQILDARHRRA